MQKRIISTLILGLLSCAVFAQYPVYGPSPSILQSDTAELVKRLRDQKVQVIQEGDNLRLIIPTDIFFDPLSVQLSQEHLDTWAAIAQLLNCYDSRLMTVEGHTDNVGNLQSKLTRSYLLAHNVSAYLWSNGIPLYRMKVIGCADLKPIASNKNSLSSQMNRRVEILISL